VRRLIAFGFPLAAVCVALFGPMNDARAQKPMAVCKDGKCVVSEADWKRFKEFWKRVEQFARDMDEKAQADQKGQWAQAQKLESCLAILAERKE
jgi:hypothetical protein